MIRGLGNVLELKIYTVNIRKQFAKLHLFSRSHSGMKEGIMVVCHFIHPSSKSGRLQGYQILTNQNVVGRAHQFQQLCHKRQGVMDYCLSMYLIS